MGLCRSFTTQPHLFVVHRRREDCGKRRMVGPIVWNVPVQHTGREVRRYLRVAIWQLAIRIERLRPLRVWHTAGSCHKTIMAAPGRVAHKAAIMDGYICLSIVIVFERKLVNVKHARCTARKFIAISATGSCHDDIGGYAACRTILKFEFKGLIFGA